METKTIQANGLEFAYYEQGTGDNLVLCLHGFPDTADTWLDLMPRLAAEKYRVIAPFMRGYPPTGIPADGHYSANDLAADVVGLLDAFGAETAILIGHDWGAATAYAVATLHPERVSKLITIAIPHPRALKFTWKTVLKARHFITFQWRGMSIRWMKRNNYAAIGAIFKRWSPNWRFTEADIAPVRKSLSQPGGVEAALGYYWSSRGNRGDPAAQNPYRGKIDAPTLTILGAADGALTFDPLAPTANFFTAQYEQVILPDVGHFLHRETPDAFAELVLNFLKA
jgi:pimeloyl-ACP methyl ester carboxylesterase